MPWRPPKVAQTISPFLTLFSPFFKAFQIEFWKFSKRTLLSWLAAVRITENFGESWRILPYLEHFRVRQVSFQRRPTSETGRFLRESPEFWGHLRRLSTSSMTGSISTDSVKLNWCETRFRFTICPVSADSLWDFVVGTFDWHPVDLIRLKFFTGTIGVGFLLFISKDSPRLLHDFSILWDTGRRFPQVPAEFRRFPQMAESFFMLEFGALTSCSSTYFLSLILRVPKEWSYCSIFTTLSRGTIKREME